MIFLYFFAALFPLIAEGLNQNNDHGLWLEQEVKKKLSDQWTFHFNTRQRWGSDYKLFWFHAYEPTVRYKLMSGHFDVFISGGFREYSHIRKNTLGNTKWVWVFMPLLEMYVNLKYKDWKLRQRLRGEYHHYQSSHYKEYGDCRYRVELFSPWELSCLKFKPYISNEWFIRSNTYHKTHPNGLVGGVYEDRFRIGLASTLWKDTVTSAIFWQWRFLKQTPETHPRWYNTYQLGFALRFSF